MNAMLGKVRSRDLRDDIRLAFVQIQVTPLPLAMIVNRTRLPARRAEHRAIMHDEGFDDFRSAIDVHVRHAPRRLYTKQLLLNSNIPHAQDYATTVPTYCLRPLKSLKSHF